MGSNFLNLTGTSGNYASAPAAASVKLAGDFDIRAKILHATYLPSTTARVVCRELSGADRSYGLSIETGGAPSIYATSNGSTLLTATCSASMTPFAGVPIHLRATLDADDGSSNRVFKFWTSTNGVTWTQLGVTSTTAGTVAVFAGTSPIEIGTRITGSQNFFVGRIYSVQIRDNILDNGTGIVFDADFSGQAANTTSFTESSSNAATVTINGTAAIRPTPSSSAAVLVDALGLGFF